MGVLKVKVDGVWQEVTSQAEPPLDEVWIGTDPPDPVGTWETWFDTSTYPAVLKYRAPNGAWTEASTGNEVWIGVEDPYLLNPNGHYELWHDTSIGGGNGKLKAYFGGQWHPIAEFNESEVEIGPTDPTTVLQPGSTELWVDSSTSPIVLKAWVNGGWQEVAGPEVLPAPQEVEISPAQPRETTVELWYDTTNSPKGQLRANNNGTWEDIGGTSEVTVSNVDPYDTNPLAEDELWVDTSAGAPGILKYRNAPQDIWIEVIQRATGVAFEQQYGQEPQAGNLNSLAREDHSHGTPLEEVVVSDTDPMTIPTGTGAELWYDTATTTSMATLGFTTEIGQLRQRVEQLELQVQTLESRR